MKIAAKLVLAAAILLAVPSLSAAGQWDLRDRMQMREEIRREVRDAVRHAHRDAWTARWQGRRDAQRMAREMRREAMRMRSDLMRHAYRSHRHDWRD